MEKPLLNQHYRKIAEEGTIIFKNFKDLLVDGIKSIFFWGTGVCRYRPPVPRTQCVEVGSK